VLPLLAWQFIFMTILRYAPEQVLTTIPFFEQLTMGVGEFSEWSYILFLVWDTYDRIPNYGFDFNADRPAMRPAYGTPDQVAGVWAKPTRQLIWCSF
jgi:hypothetical protein